MDAQHTSRQRQYLSSVPLYTNTPALSTPFPRSHRNLQHALRPRDAIPRDHLPHQHRQRRERESLNVLPPRLRCLDGRGCLGCLSLVAELIVPLAWLRGVERLVDLPERVIVAAAVGSGVLARRGGRIGGRVDEGEKVRVEGECEVGFFDEVFCGSACITGKRRCASCLLQS